MRRRTLPFLMTLLLAATACGPAQVVVTVEVEMNDAEMGTVVRQLSDVEVQLIPYDRDAIFDSLTNAFGTPEPAVPQELIDARDEVAAAQAEWQAAEQRWNTLRDTLQKINSSLEQYNRGEARYVALYNEFRDFEAELDRVDRQVQGLFQRFTDLQGGTIRQSDSIRILQDNWADEAYVDFFDVATAKVRASGLQQAADTTDASGVAADLMVPPGQYWVHARYELPYTELYWNVRIDVQRGEPVTITLNRANARERLNL
jgi:uncharacterized protein (DUF3084 family)